MVFWHFAAHKIVHVLELGAAWSGSSFPWLPSSNATRASTGVNALHAGPAEIPSAHWKKRKATPKSIRIPGSQARSPRSARAEVSKPCPLCPGAAFLTAVAPPYFVAQTQVTRARQPLHLSCCRFGGHRVKVSHPIGGRKCSVENSAASSSSKR